MQPLAERMRPRVLDEYIGQEHLVAKGAVLEQAVQSGKIPSFILWGPPGVGKTTLARIVSNQLKRPFQSLSAINSGVKDIREAIQKAEKQRFFDSPNPILFIDEIHRFSKSQQDALLGAVEKGTITLIGATTENPSFEVIPALLSRCQVYVLEALNKENLLKIVDRALTQDIELKKKQVTIKEHTALLRYSGGDARKLLNILELVCNQDTEEIIITDEQVIQKLQRNIAHYDKGGEQHYDVISAFIKSIRGSDPDAAVYWLGRMVEGGEDIEFICRRMIISASEDVGLANPNALLMATTCMQAVRMVGLPEARIIMSQAAIYLATSPKSNSAYLAIKKAQKTIRQEGSAPVPLHLRNSPTKLMKELGYGEEYKYAHDFPGNFVAQSFLPKELQEQHFYEPLNNPTEVKIKERMEKLWGQKKS